MVRSLNRVHELHDWNGNTVLRTRDVQQIVSLASETTPWTTNGGMTYDRPRYLVVLPSPTGAELIGEHLHEVLRLTVLWARVRLFKFI